MPSSLSKTRCHRQSSGDFARLDAHRSARLALALAWASAWLMAAGCQTEPPPIRAEADVNALAGLSARGDGGGVEFLTIGDPVDEPSDSGPRLGASEALRRALRTDPGLQAALARIRIALAEAQQARLWPNPLLSVVLRFPENSGKPLVEASLAADIIAILQSPGRARAADHRLRQAAAEALSVALDVIQSVQESYAAIQSADRQRPLLEERCAILGKLERLIQTRLDAQEASRSELTALATQRIGLEIELAELARKRQDLGLQLARQIGQPSSSPNWVVDEPLASGPSSSGNSDTARALDPQRLIELALRYRPEVQSRLWTIAALGDDLDLARWALFEGSSLSLETQRNDVWEVGPGISTPLPLFDWGQAKRDKLTAQQIEARHLLTQTKRQIVEDVRRAAVALTASTSSLERSRSELIPLLQRRCEQARAMFAAGETDSTPLLLAEHDLRAGQAKLVELQHDAASALIRLQRAVGGPVVLTAPEPAAAPRGGDEDAASARRPETAALTTPASQTPSTPSTPLAKFHP